MMRTERLEFEGSAGGRLAARLDLPDGEIKGYGLFAHCFTCSKDFKVISIIGKQLAAEGLATLRFDFTGLGQSEGDFAETTFTTNLNDLLAAAKRMEEQYEPIRFIVGHSLGGSAVLAVAKQIPSLLCVATIGAPADPVHVRNLFTGADFDENDRAEVSIGGRPFQIGKQFVDDLEQHDLATAIGSMKLPLMVFHGPADTIVGINNAEKIFKAAKHPKSFVSLGNADHLVSNPKDAAFLGHVLSAWANYYVE